MIGPSSSRHMAANAAVRAVRYQTVSAERRSCTGWLPENHSIKLLVGREVDGNGTKAAEQPRRCGVLPQRMLRQCFLLLHILRLGISLLGISLQPSERRIGQRVSRACTSLVLLCYLRVIVVRSKGCFWLDGRVRYVLVTQGRWFSPFWRTLCI